MGLIVLEVAEIALGGFCEQISAEHLVQVLTDSTLCLWSHVKVVHSFRVQPRESPPLPYLLLRAPPAHLHRLNLQGLSGVSAPGSPTLDPSRGQPGDPGWEENPETQRRGLTLL